VWPIGAVSDWSKGEALAEIAADEAGRNRRGFRRRPPIATPKLLRQGWSIARALDLPVIDHAKTARYLPAR